MLELTIRLVVSLAIVVGLLLLLARFGARRFRGNTGALVQVIHRQPLSRTSAVAVVTIGSRVLVLGTTEQQVSVLAELDPEELELADLALTDVEPADRPSALAVISTSSMSGTAPVSGAFAMSAEEMPATSRGPGSHRATAATMPTPAEGLLAGSVLSAQTWRQAFQVATGRGSARRAS